MRRLTLLAFITLTGVLSLSVTPVFAVPEEVVALDLFPATTAYADVDGVPTKISAGSVIGQGVLVGELCLVVKPIEVGVYVPDDSTPLIIEWEFDGRCRAVVLSIAAASSIVDEPTGGKAEETRVKVPEQLESPPGGCCLSQSQFHPGSSWHRHKGRAVGWVEEQFDIPVNRVTSRMYYWEDPRQVGYGHDGLCRYWWRSGTGWSMRLPTCKWKPTGPDVVWIKGAANFDHPFNIHYRLSSKFWADAVDRHAWGYVCKLESGSLPPYWDKFCWGERLKA